MTAESKPLGIVAGYGRFPAIVAKAAKTQGYKTVIVSIEHEASQEVAALADVLDCQPADKLGAITDALKAQGVTQAVMVGKVDKSTVFKRNQPDEMTKEALSLLTDMSDDNILRAIASVMEKHGVKLMDATFCTASLKTREGVLSARAPTPGEEKDIKFGWKMAKELGRLDVGQTAIVKELSVVALEAIEGTDRAILRAGELAGKGTVVVKVAKPYQDLRFDAPAVGPDTISNMVKAGATVLAIEAEKSIILDIEEAIDIADKAGIAVVGIKDQGGA